MKVNATDADEEGNENSKIAYSIVDQNPPGMFYIDTNGNVFVKQSSLDREVRKTAFTPQERLSFDS